MAETAPAQPQVVVVQPAVVMVPEQDLENLSNHKTNACCYALLSSLYLVIFLIATIMNPVQFLLYSLLAGGYFLWFVVAMIVSGIVATINCSYACCYAPDGCCAGYRTCFDFVTLILWFIVFIWGFGVVGSTGFALLSGNLKPGTPAYDALDADGKKAAKDFAKATDSVSAPGGGTLSDFLAVLAGPIQAMVFTALIGFILAFLCMFAFWFMCRSEGGRQWIMEHKGSVKYLPWGAWALTRASGWKE